MSASIGACDLVRGVGRALTEADHTVLTELPLGNGRRADLVALDRTGSIILVEVKSCRADFAADRKWQEYLAYCDRFYFAVGPDFPRAFLPPEEGLILADRFGGEIIRAARLRALSPARRKAMLIRFGRAAASRLQSLIDPQPYAGKLKEVAVPAHAIAASSSFLFRRS
jgi:hypothetical protein